MELVDGVDLRRRLRTGSLAVRQVAQIGHDIADGLEYVHERDIVHRDIKPANILLSDAAFDPSRGRIRAKLTDFGIALRGESGEVDEDGTISGTVAYFSPEQARGEPLGPASDVYSLGLVLLECFTGELAFPGSAIESSAARLTRDPDIPAELPVFWRELLRAMTDRDPLNRPHVYDIAIALRQAVADGSGRHRLEPASEPELVPVIVDPVTEPVVLTPRRAAAESESLGFAAS
jgi:serine/threonine protein kinase